MADFIGKIKLFLIERPALLFVLSGLSFTLVSIPIRQLGDDIPTLEKTFFRNIFGFFFILLLAWRQKEVPYQTRAPFLQILRALLGVVAMSLSFYAIENIDLALFSSLSFLKPVFVLIASALILKEKVGWRRWSATFIALLGVFMATGFTWDLSLGAYAVLASVFFMTGVSLVVKKLSQIDAPSVTIFYMGLLISPISLLLTLIFDDWVWPRLHHYPWLLMIGLLATIAQLGMIHAMKHSDLSRLQPFDFLKLVWSALIGFFIFAEAIEFHVLLGGSIILLATIYMGYREKIKRQIEK